MSELEAAVSLLEEALFLCMNGERAPGGDETWGEWCRKTEFFLRGRYGDDDPEGGVREPAGDSPDSPPAGESRLPGGSDDYLPVENRPDDSAGIGAVTLLEKISGIPSNGILVYDMVLPPPIKEGDLWKPFRNVLAGSRTDEMEHELASGR